MYAHDGRPLLVTAAGEDSQAVLSFTAQPFSRISPADAHIDERWLQHLLYKHPDLLPLDDLDVAFAPLITVAREIRTESGSIDLLLVNPFGYLTIVQTKMYRNPEARRQVSGQIPDYGSRLTLGD